MMLETVLTIPGILVLVYFLIKVLKPIKRYVDHCDNVVREWCDEQEEELWEEMLERMREFLDMEKYESPALIYERMRCNDEDSRYFKVAHDHAKLQSMYEKEDREIARELKKRQEKIRDLIAVIEKTGQSPKTISEIYEIMRIEWK